MTTIFVESLTAVAPADTVLLLTVDRVKQQSPTFFVPRLTNILTDQHRDKLKRVTKNNFVLNEAVVSL